MGTLDFNLNISITTQMPSSSNKSMTKLLHVQIYQHIEMDDTDMLFHQTMRKVCPLSGCLAQNVSIFINVDFLMHRV